MKPMDYNASLLKIAKKSKQKQKKLFIYEKKNGFLRNASYTAGEGAKFRSTKSDSDNSLQKFG